MKPVTALTPDDFSRFPLWRFADQDESDEPAVEPIAEMAVTSLSGLLVGAQVLLANASPRLALIGNVDQTDPRAIEHFLTLSLWHDGAWLHLARYHDFDYANAGPDGFCTALGLPAEQVFPIDYDLCRFVAGGPAILKGTIPMQPREQLTRAELIHLALKR